HGVDLAEHLLHLRFEIVGNVVALVVLRRRLAGDPDNGSARGDDAGREGARELERRLFHVFGGRGRGGESRGGSQRQQSASHLKNSPVRNKAAIMPVSLKPVT